MPSLIPAFTLRIPEELMDKLRVVAEINKRSVNKEIEYLIEQYIKKYEKETKPID